MRGMVFNVMLVIILMVIIIALSVIILFQILGHSEEEVGSFSDFADKDIMTTARFEWIKWIHNGDESGSDYAFKYDFEIRDVKFQFNLEEEFQDVDFVVIADFKDKIAIHHYPLGETVIRYSELEDRTILHFTLESDDEPTAKNLVHLTFWENGECITDFFKDALDTSKFYYEGEVSELIRKCPGFYMSSVDIAEFRARELVVKLNVKDGPADGKTGLRRYYITNNPSDETEDNCKQWRNLDGLTPMPENTCLICSIEHDEADIIAIPPRPVARDDGALTITSPGSIISENYDNLKEGLVNAIFRPNGKGLQVLDEPWNLDPEIADEKIDKELIAKNEVTGDLYYMPGVDLICDNSGYWWVCDYLMQDKVLNVSNTIYACNQGSWGLCEYDNCENCTAAGCGWCVFGTAEYCVENTVDNENICISTGGMGGGGSWHTNTCPGTPASTISSSTTTSSSTTSTSSTSSSTTTSTTVPPAACWDGSNTYILRNEDQYRKFCKCAQGAYGRMGNSFDTPPVPVTAYQYVDIGDNDIWTVTPVTVSDPVNFVRCLDGVWYSTDQTYP